MINHRYVILVIVFLSISFLNNEFLINNRIHISSMACSKKELFLSIYWMNLWLFEKLENFLQREKVGFSIALIIIQTS